MTFYQALTQQTETERTRLLSTPVIRDCLNGWITLRIYRAFLAEAYHHVRHTVPLLMACGARMPQRLEWLREAVAKYIEEETGHQDWILNDLAASGADPEAIRNGQPGQATDIMVAYAWDTVMRRNPVGFFGMVLVLEGTSAHIASPAADAIQKVLGLPDSAFSYLRSHGSLDQEHIAFFESLVNRLETPEDQSAVLRTAKVMYGLYGNIFRGLPALETREAA
jgi:pyrroloquinoline quinone (PQQ) biosynthesis protein C